VNKQEPKEFVEGTCRQAAMLGSKSGGRAGCSAPPSSNGFDSPGWPQSAGGETVEPLAEVVGALLDRDHRTALVQAYTFLPGLVEQYLARQELPTKRELAVLFVDVADSTSTILHQPPEVALAAVQHFMRVVTDVALAHCGDVKDYEGDGALLYFASIGAATRAALAIRAALATERSRGGTLLHARLSLNIGEVVIGVIGSPLRRSVALIGPAVSLASRLLKHIPPGGIIAPQAAVEQLRQEAPDLAQQFQPWGDCLILKGFEEECVTAYHISGGVAASRPAVTWRRDTSEKLPATASRPPAQGQNPPGSTRWRSKSCKRSGSIAAGTLPSPEALPGAGVALRDQGGRESSSMPMTKPIKAEG
jgi:class 3 adenylate cyclase